VQRCPSERRKPPQERKGGKDVTAVVRPSSPTMSLLPPTAPAIEWGVRAGGEGEEVLDDDGCTVDGTDGGVVAATVPLTSRDHRLCGGSWPASVRHTREASRTTLEVERWRVSMGRSGTVVPLAAGEVTRRRIGDSAQSVGGGADGWARHGAPTASPSR
jgi:hypothetical protein